MNIKKFIKTNRLFLAALLVLLVIISILLSLRAPSVSYSISPDKVASMLTEKGNQVSPITLYEDLLKDNSAQVLVDIRSTDEFAKGHIEKAVNIPVRELFQKHSLEFFRELHKNNRIVILYGEDQLQANGPWMLLKQVGINNVKVLQGGYAFYKSLPLADSLIRKDTISWLIESPIIDTTAFRKYTHSAAVKVASKKVEKEKVIPVKKEVSSGGGC